MIMLALDCSAGPASCAVTSNGEIVTCAAVNVATTHSQTLMPMVEKCLSDAGLRVADMDRIAVSNGPGSFTGIRIGIATVKGLADGSGVPVTGVSTLAAMARNFDGLPIDAVICATMDARCRQVYTACFACENGKITRMTDDEALILDELFENLSKIKKPIILVGDGANLCYTFLRDRLPSIRIAPPHLRFQSACGVAAEAAANGTPTPAAQLFPVYLRLPQAERELKKKQSLNN